MSDPPRILSHVPITLPSKKEGGLADCEVVVVPADGPIDVSAWGEVLLTLPWGTPNMAEVVGRGVRWIHTLGTGVDRFPFEVVGDRLLTCSRGASGGPISEWIVAMMLAFEKRLPEMWVEEAPERWNIGYDVGTLRGRTLGLVGFGAIGRAVARLVEPFGMQVVACRRRALPAAVPGVTLTSFDEVLARADHLVLAAPATPATKGLLDDAAFSRLKGGVHVINVARGSLIDQDALRRALDAGRVARASLDTVDPEPLPAGHWLYTHPSARVSPHVSWTMPDAIGAFFEIFEENLVRYRRGEPLEGLVDPSQGY